MFCRDCVFKSKEHIKLFLCITFGIIATGYPQSTKQPPLLRCALLHEGAIVSLLPCHSCTALRLGMSARGKAAGQQKGWSTPPPRTSLENTTDVQNPGARGLGRRQNPYEFGVLFRATGTPPQAAGPGSLRLEHRCSRARRGPHPSAHRPRSLTCSGPWKQILQSGVRMPLSTLLPSE